MVFPVECLWFWSWSCRCSSSITVLPAPLSAESPSFFSFIYLFIYFELSHHPARLRGAGCPATCALIGREQPPRGEASRFTSRLRCSYLWLCRATNAAFLWCYCHSSELTAQRLTGTHTQTMLLRNLTLLLLQPGSFSWHQRIRCIPQDVAARDRLRCNVTEHSSVYICSIELSDTVRMISSFLMLLIDFKGHDQLQLLSASTSKNCDLLRSAPVKGQRCCRGVTLMSQL